MTYDSATPNLESNPNNVEPAQVHKENVEPVLPDAEVDTVLHFISSPIDDGNHFISSLANETISSQQWDEKSTENSIVVETSIPTYLSTPVAEYKVDLLLDDKEERMTRDINSDVDSNTQVPITPNQLLDTSSQNTEIVADNNPDPPGDNLSKNVSSGFEQKMLPHPGSTVVPSSISESEPDNGSDNTQEEGIISNLDSDEDITFDSLPKPAPNRNLQVQFKTEAEQLVIILPKESQVSISEYSWSEIWQQLKQRLNGGERLRVANTNVHLVAGDRLLDARQLQELADSLKEVELQLKSVATSRRQTAVAAVTAGYSVEQLQLQPKNSFSTQDKLPATHGAEPLYMEMTIRSGVEIRHPATVIILGDVNPGGIVIADGDILVWGRLRGVAHAGANGNSECLIMALQMEPTQLRIADAVARAPEKSPKHLQPEVAYVTSGAIRIAKAADFSRLSKINQ
jgi:septum site-determining protein MinC